VLVYVVAQCLALLTIGDRNRFNRLGAAMGSLGARLILCAVVLAALFHTLDGLRRLLAEVAPAVRRRDEPIRAGVLFATLALGLPAMAVVVWPWVTETFR
jgi:succinate dehydrogenase/fumarate reductase cytochrome b subunit